MKYPLFLQTRLLLCALLINAPLLPAVLHGETDIVFKEDFEKRLGNWWNIELPEGKDDAAKVVETEAHTGSASLRFADDGQSPVRVRLFLKKVPELKLHPSLTYELTFWTKFSAGDENISLQIFQGEHPAERVFERKLIKDKQDWVKHRYTLGHASQGLDVQLESAKGKVSLLFKTASPGRKTECYLDDLEIQVLTQE